MATFSDGVSTLLETYTRCLCLVKALGERGPGAASADPRSSRLSSRIRRSIRSDRSQVSLAYSASLWKNGRRLEKGDSLRRITERLEIAISSLLNTTKSQGGVADYESLISLSNTSRADAIKTISRLSHRLSSSSSLGREDHRSRSLTPGSKDRKPRTKNTKNVGKHAHKSSSSTSSTDPGSVGAKESQGGAPVRHKKSSLQRRPGPKTPENKASKISSVVQKRGKPNETALVPSPTGEIVRTRPPDRISCISTSSDSTQLGEIPYLYRQSLLCQHPHAGSPQGYNVQPVYPLRAYQPAPKGKRSLLRRIFGSSPST